jgi:YycE-like C-terminal domain
VLLGLPGMQYHLEFTQHDHGSPAPAPSGDSLLVLYFDDLAQVKQVAARLATLGHLPVEAENPYWTEHGAVTVEDPDHWRVVLMPQPPPYLVDARAMTRLGTPADLPAASDVYRSASLSNAGDSLTAEELGRLEAAGGRARAELGRTCGRGDADSLPSPGHGCGRGSK